MKIRQLLLTTDFSENARKSYHFASDLARKFSAKLHLAHFTGEAPMVVLGPTNDEFFEARRQALHNESNTRTEFEGLDVVKHLEPYRWTPDRFRNLEKEEDIDLVVMGTHGRTGAQHFVMGSFAERVVRNSSVPVLVCRDPDTQSVFEPKLIVVPIDFSELTDTIVPAVRFLASSSPCRFRFIYVYEPLPAKGFPVVNAVRDFLTHRPKEPVESRFSELIQSQLADVDATLETCQGAPSVEIVNRVRELQADLVVVGTHGVLGSVAQNVTREASCSVLTVPKKGLT